ncbi:hypothetical protein J2W25_004642 [Variovorax boronicumulans]|uniref:Type I restriction endonuclease subunit M n=2 Tax=Variovorax boronicumulans TaxID=436515 RepID=A0AAW8E211_9BURK|nr:hypothetical protein [Variovorax boronicumulans]MDP9880313.1 hypothetical protein [Variovorax boronicumulans]MDP9925599.1 hypothetical protein [Variovorax boronicumulans]
MPNPRQGQACPLFSLGRIYATPGALKLLNRHQQTATTLLARHARGDWGLVPPEDVAANDQAVRDGFRILSSYAVGTTTTAGRPEVIWVITEADRSITTLLLPKAY